MFAQLSRWRRRRRFKPETVGFLRSDRGETGIEVARACVDSCWQAPFFAPGRGQDCDFELRSVVRCRSSLAALGHGEALQENLDWALGCWLRAGRVTSRVSAEGEAYECEGYSCDALPSVMEWVAEAGDRSLSAAVRDLLEAEVERYFDLVLEPLSGELRRHRVIPGWRRGRRLMGSCEVVCQLASLQQSLGRLGWSTDPLGFDALVALDEWFWTGAYYREDSVQQPARCGVVGNVLPFALRLPIQNAKEKLRLIARSFEELALNEPLPFRFERAAQEVEELPPLSWICPGAQGAGASSLAALLWAKAQIDINGASEGALGAGLEALEAKSIVDQMLGEVELAGTLYEERASVGIPVAGSRWDSLASSVLVELAERLNLTNA